MVTGRFNKRIGAAGGVTLTNLFTFPYTVGLARARHVLCR